LTDTRAGRSKFGIQPYIDFFVRYPHLAVFGFLTTFGSSFGQTFFIGVFGPSVRSEFGLDHTGWSTVYLVGTLASALVLPWTGKQVDRVKPERFAMLVWISLAIACALFSLAWSAAALAVGIFALRQCGQGLMSHLSLTTMARYFERQRGRALAFATLGYAAGQALLPLLMVTLITYIGWRWSYRIGALALLLAVGPAIWLLRRGRKTAADDLGHEARGSSARRVASVDWTRGDVLRDVRFYLLLPGLLCPSVVSTAVFFHQLVIADAKLWSHSLVAGSYPVYSVAVMSMSLMSGPLIDRTSALRWLPFMLIPMGFGVGLLSVTDHFWALWLYLALLGATSGLGQTVGQAIWAELYGVRHIGAIRSLAASLSVFGSALGPIGIGVLMDADYSIESVCALLAGYCAFGTVMLAIAVHTPLNRSKAPPASS
jgi:MFS family permease